MRLTSAPFALVWLFGLALSIPAAAPARDPSPKKPADVPAHRDYTAFKLIAERNIFNSARSSRSGRARADERKPSHVDTLTLVGTLAYEKGFYAFFDGSSGAYKKVVEPGSEIAGYKIAQVDGNRVQLEAGTNTVNLTVGMQMRREEEGDWQVIGGSAADSKTAAASASSADDENDIVKRMMQQREQELK